MVRNLYQFLTIKNKLNMSEATSLELENLVPEKKLTPKQIFEKIEVLSKACPALFHLCRSSSEVLIRHGLHEHADTGGYKFVVARLSEVITLCAKIKITRVSLTYKIEDDLFDRTISGPIKIAVESGLVEIFFSFGKSELEKVGFIVKESKEEGYPWVVFVHPFFVKGIELGES